MDHISNDVPGARADAGNALDQPLNSRFHWRGFLQGLLVVLMLVLIKVWFEHTELGTEVERVTYRFVQEHLEGQNRKTPSAVVVVDISDLEPEPWQVSNRWHRVTSRDALRDLIQSLADARVRAIGVDIDFSPREGGLVFAKDPEFFSFCQSLSRQRAIPIRLGVFRGQAKRPEQWLGEARFADLAASIAVPNSRHLPRWLRTIETKWPLPGMSAALVLDRKDLVQKPTAWHRAVVNEAKVKRVGSHLEVAEYLVDLSWLSRLMGEKISTYEGAGIKALQRLVGGRIVLLGDATEGVAADVFVVPGFEDPVPGVFLHACGVATLAGRPLYELSHLARISIDASLALAVLGGVSWLCFFYERRQGQKVNQRFLHNVVTFGAILLTCALGFVFVGTTRVLWTDFVLVALALLLHSPAERSSGRLLRGLRAWWLRHLFSQNPNQCKPI